MGMTGALADVAVAATKHVAKKASRKGASTLAKKSLTKTPKVRPKISQRLAPKAASPLPPIDQFRKDGLFKGIPEPEQKSLEKLIEAKAKDPKELGLIENSLRDQQSPDPNIRNKAAGAWDEMMLKNQLPFDEKNLIVQRQQEQWSKVNGHKQQLPEEVAKTKLDYFISENQVDLSTAPKGRMMTTEGMQDVPMNPNTKEELLPKIQQYIDLQKATGSKQPKAGWEKVFGNVADEEGNPLRITGGVDKPGRWQKHNMPSRKFAEGLFAEGEDKARLKIMSLQKNQKHHGEWAVKESEIFGTTDDGIARSAEDRDYINSEIKRRFGIDFGNKDAQEIAQSQRAHMGVKGDEASLKLASHRILDNISDVQGFREWQFEASDIKFEMPLRKNQKNPTVKWFKNKDGIIYEAAKGEKSGKAIGDMASFKKKYPKSEAVGFKMPGTLGGTYSPAQRHGFSQELIETIRKLHDPEDVIKVIGLFKESGVGELRKGASALASSVLEKNPVDPGTTKWIQNNMKQALDIADVMKKQPGIMEIPEFKQFIEATQMVNNMKQYKRDLPNL